MHILHRSSYMFFLLHFLSLFILKQLFNLMPVCNVSVVIILLLQKNILLFETLSEELIHKAQEVQLQ